MSWVSRLEPPSSDMSGPEPLQTMAFSDLTPDHQALMSAWAIRASHEMANDDRTCLTEGSSNIILQGHPFGLVPMCAVVEGESGIG